MTKIWRIVYPHRVFSLKEPGENPKSVIMPLGFGQIRLQALQVSILQLRYGVLDTLLGAQFLQFGAGLDYALATFSRALPMAL